MICHGMEGLDREIPGTCCGGADVTHDVSRHGGVKLGGLSQEVLTWHIETCSQLHSFGCARHEIRRANLRILGVL